MKVHQPIVLCMALLMAGCSSLGGMTPGQRVDGSTEASTQSSLQAIYAQRSARDICLLQAAVAQISAGEKAKQPNASATPSVGPVINGMTYSQILEAANNYPKIATTVCSV